MNPSGMPQFPSRSQYPPYDPYAIQSNGIPNLNQNSIPLGGFVGSDWKPFLGINQGINRLDYKNIGVLLFFLPFAQIDNYFVTPRN